MNEYNYRVMKIYINENERYKGMPLYEWILHRAQEKGILAATVIRGIEGLDTKHKLHTIKLLTLSIDLPLKIEIIDKREKISELYSIVKEAVEEGIITFEQVKARIFSKHKKKD